MLPLVNSKKHRIVVGALLTAGLLLFLQSRKSAGPSIEAEGLKPSQLDFTQGNHIQDPVETVVITPTTEVKALSATTNNKLSAAEKLKIDLLDEVIKSKNDNDPRIDQELKSMSTEMHEALYEKYENMDMENRNGRGMITFLIARDFKTTEDAEFLKKVFNESPCTSMSNCHEVASTDSHHSGIEQNSLNYPQLAALYQLESRIEKDALLLRDRIFFRNASSVVQQAKRFPVPLIQNKANELSEKYGL